MMENDNETKDIHCYGEDAITLWALTNGLPELKSAFQHAREDNQFKLIFYRPSFGRGNGFGEFDLILLTNTIWLVEAKIARNPKIKINLSDAQIERHEIFKKLIEEVRAFPEENNLEAGKREVQISECINMILRAFKEKSVYSAKPDSILTCNVDAVIRKIIKADPNVRTQVKHLLLIYCPESNPRQRQDLSPKEQQQSEESRTGSGKVVFNKLVLYVDQKFIKMGPFMIKLLA